MRDIFTPSLIWDLALIAVILFVMIRSVGRGIVSSLIHLLGLAAACIVAALLSGKAAAWLYDGYLAERLQTAVSDTLRQKLQTFAELLDRIDPTDTITGAAGDALRTVMVALLTMVAFLIIFLVAMVIVRALAKLTRNVNRVPVVGGSRPARIFMRVDLPAPFSPRTASTSPGAISMLMPSLATIPGYRLVIFFRLRRGCMLRQDAGSGVRVKNLFGPAPPPQDGRPRI